MEVRNAWGELAMRDRYVRVGLVALILAMPWLMAVADPASSAFSASRIGTMFLADMILAVGLLWAGRERHALLSPSLSSRGQALPPRPELVVLDPAPLPVSVPVSVSVPSSRPAAVAPAL